MSSWKIKTEIGKDLLIEVVSILIEVSGKSWWVRLLKILLPLILKLIPEQIEIDTEGSKEKALEVASKVDWEKYADKLKGVN